MRTEVGETLRWDAGLKFVDHPPDPVDLAACNKFKWRSTRERLVRRLKPMLEKSGPYDAGKRFLESWNLGQPLVVHRCSESVLVMSTHRGKSNPARRSNRHFPALASAGTSMCSRETQRAPS